MGKSLNIVKKLIGIIMALFLCVMLVSCGKADISAYKDQQIKIIGLLDEDFYITPGELSEMECTSATAQGKSAKAGTVKAYGPTMETFLEHYGKTFDDFRSIRCVASDDYVVTLGRASWEKYDIIMSIANGSEPLYESQQPLRIVIPGANSGNWIRTVTSIEFTYAE